MRSSILIAISLSMAGCDTAFRVRGIAPEQPGCSVTIIDESSGEEYESFNVKGEFIETIVVGGVFIPSFTASASCGGRNVKSVKDIRLTNENYDNPVELGNIAP